MAHDINKRTEAAMHSIDGIMQAEPRPFLLTRINAAMQSSMQKNTWMEIAGFLKRPAVAITTGAVVLLLNAFAFKTELSSHSKDAVAKNLRAAKYDFTNINVSGIYDTEIQEP